MLELRTTGMEFASEMVIRAAKAELEIRQLPIAYHPRGGVSKLSSFRDGWRHLRFLLVHSPTHLFVLPGALLLLAGVLIALVSLSGIELLRPRVAAALDDRRLAARHRRHPGPRARPLRPRLRPLLHGRARGVVRPDARALSPRARPPPRRRDLLAGLVIAATIVVTWVDHGFGVLSEERLAVAAATLITVGLQVVFSSFLLSILGLRRRDDLSSDC